VIPFAPSVCGDRVNIYYGDLNLTPRAPREIGNMLKSNSYRTTRDSGAALAQRSRGSHALLAPNRGLGAMLGADPSRARSTQHRSVIDYWKPH
jgi:hypothetical protein